MSNEEKQFRETFLLLVVENKMSSVNSLSYLICIYKRKL